MNELERLRTLLEQTDRQIQQVEQQIASSPQEASFQLELKSLQKVKSQLESEAVTIEGRLIGVDVGRRIFRLELADGSMVEGRFAMGLEAQYPLQVPGAYRVMVRAVRRPHRAGNGRTAYLLSDLSPSVS
jgi:hypothetical protein